MLVSVRGTRTMRAWRKRMAGEHACRTVVELLTINNQSINCNQNCTSIPIDTCSAVSRKERFMKPCPRVLSVGGGGPNFPPFPSRAAIEEEWGRQYGLNEDRLGRGVKKSQALRGLLSDATTGTLKASPPHQGSLAPGPCRTPSHMICKCGC